MQLTPEDINELLVVLNTALSEARLRADWPQEHINTYRAYMDTIRKWIHLLSQQVGAFVDEPTLRECPYCHQMHLASDIEHCPLKPR